MRAITRGRRVIPIFTLTLLGLASQWICSPLAAQAKKPPRKTRDGSRWAILIGVNDYAQANDLEYCVADQKGLRDQLIASGFPEKQVFLLHDDANDKKYLPFKSNIERALAVILGLVEEDDLVVVAFSGHGVQMGKTPYLCPTDARLDDPTTMVSLDWVYEQFQNCPAALRLLIVDACRNDPRLGTARSLKPTDGARQFARSLAVPPKGLLLLTSCTDGEVSMEEKAFGHGVFMHFLLEGLKGAADANKNGEVTLQELKKYAGTETKLYVEKKFGESQRPNLRGDLTIEAEDFPISVAAAVAPSVGSTSGIPGATIGKPKPSSSSSSGSTAGSNSTASEKKVVTLQIASWQETLKLVEAHRGKIVVIQAWGTNCPPCMRMFPNLVKLHRQYAGNGLVCMSMSLDYQGIKNKPPEFYRERVQKFLEKQGATFQNVLSSVPAGDLFDEMKLKYIPVVYVFGRDGQLVKRFDNERAEKDKDDFIYPDATKLVEELLAK